MSLAKILWVDDEIDSLTSQILFLENKGYEVATKTNGYDAVEYVKENFVDVVLLDETMPCITGLQTLQQIKENKARCLWYSLPKMKQRILWMMQLAAR